MSDKKYPAASEKVKYLEDKARALRHEFHEKMRQFREETGHSVVISFKENDDPDNYMFALQVCY